MGMNRRYGSIRVRSTVFAISVIGPAPADMEAHVSVRNQTSTVIDPLNRQRQVTRPAVVLNGDVDWDDRTAASLHPSGGHRGSIRPLISAMTRGFYAEQEAIGPVLLLTEDELSVRSAFDEELNLRVVQIDREFESRDRLPDGGSSIS